MLERSSASPTQDQSTSTTDRRQGGQHHRVGEGGTLAAEAGKGSDDPVEAAWYHARTAFRGRWRALLLLVLLVGLAGGTVLTAIAGARRSATAYDRFRDATLASDLDIAFDGEPADLDPERLQALRDLPQLEAITQSAFPFIVPAGSGFYPYLDFLAMAPMDDVAATSIDRPRLLEGRLPASNDPGEVAVLDRYARDADLHLGDVIEFESFAPAQLEPLFTTGDAGPPVGPRVTVRVTGVIDAPTFLSDSAGTFQPAVFLSRAFHEAHQDDMAVYPGGFTVRLRHGADDVPAATAAIRALFADQPGLELTPASEVDARIQASIDATVGALLVTALIAAVAGLVAVGQAFARHVAGDGNGQRGLLALGMTARERRLALVLGLAPALVGGAMLAVAVAVLASPLMPVGVARRAEPDPGLAMDGWVLVIGFGAGLLILALLARLAAGPASRDPRIVATPETDRAPSRAMRAVRAAGLAPTATIGVGLALDPRDGTRWSVRSALTGVTFGITGLVAVVVLAASLTTLLDAPDRYGTPWDSTIPGFGGEIVEQLRDPLLADDDVERLGILQTSLGRVDGQETNLHAVEALKGPMGLTLLAGRVPTGPGEVVLGSTTLRASGAGIGSVVEIEGKTALRATVVGRAAFPVVDERSSAGRGALLWSDDLAAVAPDGSLNHDLVIDWADGVDVDAASAALSEDAGAEVSPPLLPSDVNNLRQVESIPRTLAIVLAALALVVLLHALVATTRGRRRDLAVLRTLGFRRRQLSATIAWQATTIAAMGVIAGGCLGLVAGRMVWSGLARRIGVVDAPTVPVGLLLLIAAVALVVGNLAAAVPGRRAGRVRPAAVLRAG